MQVVKYVGYALFFVVMLVFGLYYTFPWESAKDRVLDLASKASGMTITAAELQPSWLTRIVAKDVKITMPGAKATLKQLHVAGDSVEMIIDGTISLLNPLARSNANLTVSFKPTDKLLKAEPLLGALLNNIVSAKGSDGFYTYSMTGTFKAPHFI